VSLPVIGFMFFTTIPNDFFPANDRDMFRVNIELPQNSSTLKSQKKAEIVRQQIIESGLIDIRQDNWFVGRRMPRVLNNVVGGKEKQGANNLAQGVFYVNDYDQMMRNLPQLSKYLVAENPDIMIYVDSFNTGPPIFADISYKIFGDDPFLLRSLGEELELIINNAPDISHTNSEASFSRTNIEIDFDSSNVSLSGKNTDILAQQLYAANNGIVVGSMLDANKEIPIRVKGISSSSDITGETSFLSIPTNNGVQLISSFGKTYLNKEFGDIKRINGQRVNNVEGWVWTGTLPSATEKFIKEEVENFKKKLPPGYTLKQGGEAETRGESQSQIYSSAAIYLVLITIGLVFALNSFRQTGLILSVAILSIGLSFVGLLVGRQNYGFIATVGAIGLIGLSINDSIIVLSHIKERAKQKVMTKADLIEVVIRSTRHIVTTSLTTLGGFLPLIFSSIFFAPLAWGMSVGVLGATLTALLYIPAMFIYLAKIKN
jgi:multidrug efflux pump subunit AcrB